MEVTEGSFHIDLHAVLADDEHGVALVVIMATGRPEIEVNEAHVFHLRDGKVVEFGTLPLTSTPLTPSSAIGQQRHRAVKRNPAQPSTGRDMGWRESTNRPRHRGHQALGDRRYADLRHDVSLVLVVCREVTT